MTSYAGLELLIRYLRRIGFNAQVRRHLGAVVNGGDFGVVALCRVILGLLVVGGRRLHHLGFVKDDGIFQRFLWPVNILPSDLSVSQGLQRFGASAVEALRKLNAEEVARVVRTCLHARTPTIDVDGTVLCTGIPGRWGCTRLESASPQGAQLIFGHGFSWPKAVISCGCTIGQGM